MLIFSHLIFVDRSLTPKAQRRRLLDDHQDRVSMRVSAILQIKPPFVLVRRASANDNFLFWSSLLRAVSFEVQLKTIIAEYLHKKSRIGRNTIFRFPRLTRMTLVRTCTVSGNRLVIAIYAFRYHFSTKISESGYKFTKNGSLTR